MENKGNLISIVRSMMDTGASVEEIVSALREMGIPEEDARRVIILANREILLSLRNDLRNIVKGVIDEERDRLAHDIKSEVRDYVETQMRLTQRNLLKFLREEVGRYVSEISRLEEKVEILERRVLDLEKEVFVKDTGTIKFRKRKILGPFFLVAGLVFLATSLLFPLESAIKLAVGVVGFVLVLGGVILAQ